MSYLPIATSPSLTRIPSHTPSSPSDAGQNSPLLAVDDSTRDEEPFLVSPGIARRLYVSHFLSTWNSRVFEFGAVLYLATIYPGTLLPMSIYAFVRGVSAIVFATPVGHYIDVGDRLKVVRVSIVGQRVTVAISCFIFYVLAKNRSSQPMEDVWLLALLAFLACGEKVCAILNLVSVEKDWVVTVAEQDPTMLPTLNAQMRRIDLLCKLFGPLFIALLDGYSTSIAIVVNLGMNVISVVLEYFAISYVYYSCPPLQQPKFGPLEIDSTNDSRSRDTTRPSSGFAYFGRIKSDFSLYVNHPAFLPSFAGALLYLTVLSFAGQMVTYLLSAGFTSNQVGIARTFSVAFEVAATWVAPWFMSQAGPTRAGLWLSVWQVATLAAGTAIFVSYANYPILSASGLVCGTILSRIGLRGFDLCVQLIVQEDVEESNRGAFSSVEAAWQNAFELLAYAATILFYRPEDFVYPTLLSLAGVTTASLCYAVYVRSRRGHLLHFEKLGAVFGRDRNS